MAYPSLTINNGTDAQNALVNKAAAAGLNEPTGGLSNTDMLAAAVANMYVDAPPAATVLTSSSVKSSSASAGIGYATGAGGAVTQITTRATGVTLSKITGQITTNTTSLAAAAFADFVVTNTAVAATDVVVVSIVPGGTGSPVASVVNVAAGSFTIRVLNQHASTADTSADVINFVVIKAVAA